MDAITPPSSANLPQKNSSRKLLIGIITTAVILLIIMIIYYVISGLKLPLFGAKNALLEGKTVPLSGRITKLSNKVIDFESTDGKKGRLEIDPNVAILMPDESGLPGNPSNDLSLIEADREVSLNLDAQTLKVVTIGYYIKVDPASIYTISSTSDAAQEISSGSASPDQ